MTALATIADLEARFGPIPPERVDEATAVLEDVSASVRAYTGQHFTRETTTVRARPRCGQVLLRQRPVHDVTDVTDITGSALGWSFDGIDTVTVPSSADVVDVTYDHGYDTIPLDIVGVVCAVAGRVLATEADPSITSESIAGYSYSRGTITAAGSWGRFDGENTVLDRYRRVGGSARLATCR